MTTSNQTLRRDLQGLAADLKWSAVEVVRIAERLSQAGNDPDAQALHRMIAMFQREEVRVSAAAIAALSTVGCMENGVAPKKTKANARVEVMAFGSDLLSESTYPIKYLVRMSEGF